MSISTAEATRLHTMGEHVRTLNAETRAARTSRNDLVRTMMERGEKVRAVALAAGISATLVMDIMTWQPPQL